MAAGYVWDYCHTPLNVNSRPSNHRTEAQGHFGAYINGHPTDSLSYTFVVTFRSIHFIRQKRPTCETICSSTSKTLETFTMPFKLYYTPISCGAASYIVASLADLSFDSEVVDLATKKTASGTDFYTINPKGNVPALVFEDGSMLNENVVTLTYLADQNPNAGLAPQSGFERYKYLNVLAFINSELHPVFAVLFSPEVDGAAREAAVQKALTKTRVFSKLFLSSNNKFLSGGELPNAVDVYACIVLSWAHHLKIDLSGVSKVPEYFDRIFNYGPLKEVYDKINEKN